MGLYSLVVLTGISVLFSVLSVSLAFVGSEEAVGEMDDSVTVCIQSTVEFGVDPDFDPLQIDVSLLYDIVMDDGVTATSMSALDAGRIHES